MSIKSVWQEGQGDSAQLLLITHAARELGRTGCDVVVIKGGHPTVDTTGEAVDVWYDGRPVIVTELIP